jgi:tRNA (cytidine/uridine-2'-O-)-methyltransferase
VNIVLYEPDIPWNTGNIGRTCVATGSTLHLIGRLGFSINDKEVRRSGLDYWAKLKLQKHPDWEAFSWTLPPNASLFFFSKKAARDYWDATFKPESYLIFGCETKGLPEFVHEKYAQNLWRIPMPGGGVRSLNLSTAVGIVLYEALRQVNSYACSDRS